MGETIFLQGKEKPNMRCPTNDGMPRSPLRQDRWWPRSPATPFQPLVDLCSVLRLAWLWLTAAYCSLLQLKLWPTLFHMLFTRPKQSKAQDQSNEAHLAGHSANVKQTSLSFSEPEPLIQTALTCCVSFCGMSMGRPCAHGNPSRG